MARKKRPIITNQEQSDLKIDVDTDKKDDITSLPVVTENGKQDAKKKVLLNNSRGLSRLSPPELRELQATYYETSAANEHNIKQAILELNNLLIKHNLENRNQRDIMIKILQDIQSTLTDLKNSLETNTITT